MSQANFINTCHAFTVKLRLLAIVLIAISSCAPNSDSSFPAPVTPPDVAPPFDEALAEQELTDENAADTDHSADDELMEFEPGLGTDEAALRSAFFTGSEDFCAAFFAQLGGPAMINENQVTISWCRKIAADIPLPLTAADESVAHAAGWNNTRDAVFLNRASICSTKRCVTVAAFPYPF